MNKIHLSTKVLQISKSDETYMYSKEVMNNKGYNDTDNLNKKE